MSTLGALRSGLGKCVLLATLAAALNLPTHAPPHVKAQQPAGPSADRPQLVLQLGPDASLSSVAFSPDGKLVASGCFNGMARLYDTQTGELQGVLGCDPSRLVNAIAFSPDGKTLASAGIHVDKTVKLWDVRTGSLLRTLAGHTNVEMNAIAFAPNGKQLASAGNDATVRLWDVKTGKLQHTLTGHEGPVTAVTFSPDGKIVASGGADKTVKFWNTQAGQLQRTLGGHLTRVNAVAFSPDGKVFVSGSSDTLRSSGLFDTSTGGEVRFWDAHSWELKRTLRERARVLSLAFSPDGKQLVGAVGKLVVLYDPQTGQRAQTQEPDGKLWAHSAEVTCIAFSPDGRTVASASHDRTVDLVDPQTKTLKLRLPGYWDQMNAVAFSPDGKTVASGSGDTRFSEGRLRANKKAVRPGAVRLSEAAT